MNGEQTKKDKAVSDLMCNIALADITKVSVEEFVKQITLIEISYFAAIKRSEFLSLKWNGRDKKIYAPNIVESTRWFNQLNFWVQKEILKYQAVNKRTEMLAFFVKLAKRLVEINNLYSAMSIVSALQVECIYRLRHTWSGLGNRERTTYRRLEELFGQQDNCRLLREHTASMRLPGIPYLGLYLSDLTYTNVAHPRINGQPTTVWVTKLNTIVDAIAHFQQSRFNFQCDETIRAYLLAQSYIEELQKFLESANFKISLQLEPPLLTDYPVPLSPTNSCGGLVDSPTTGKFHSPLDFRRGNSATVTTSRHPPCSPSAKLPPLPGYGGYNSDQEGGYSKQVTKKAQTAYCPVEPAEMTDSESGKASTKSFKGLAPKPVLSLGCGGFTAQDLVVNRALFISTQSVASLGKESPCKCIGTNYASQPSSCHSVLEEKTSRNVVERCDQAVQVSPITDPSGLTSGDPSANACLLCGHRSETADSSPTPTASPASVDVSRKDSEGRLLPTIHQSSSMGHNVCAALVATLSIAGIPEQTVNLTGTAGDTDITITNSASAAHLSVSTSSLSTALPPPWPPVRRPFTVLRRSCVLLEGPMKRKTVSRLIPPGLETPATLISREDCSATGLETSFSSNITPQHRSGGGFRSSWKTYWASLVTVDAWAETCIIYFDAIAGCRNAFRREDFTTSVCQIQSFQKAASGNENTNLPNIGLARHRNGSIDESSFLLTHPGLQKTYRLRPVTPKLTPSTPQKKNSLVGCVSVDGHTSASSPLCMSPQRKSSRRILRKEATESSETSPERTVRGSSAPMLVTNRSTIFSVKETSDLSLAPPTVEDWLQTLQVTLDSMTAAT